MAHLEWENKRSDELKRAQRKATTLDIELKGKDKEFAVTIEWLTATVKEQTLIVGKLTVAHVKLDKTQGELFEFHKVPQSLVYQWVFDHV